MVADGSGVPRRSPTGTRSALAWLSLRLRAFAAALPPPLADTLVMPGEQDLGHAPAAMLGWPCVVRVLGPAVERLAERLLAARALIAQRARQLAQHRVADDHRGQLTAREHVAADGEPVAAEMLEDALIEALVASAQQRQRGLGRELSRERVVEHAPARRERDHSPALAQVDGVGRIARAQSAFHDVYAQQHARAAPEGRVVH